MNRLNILLNYRKPKETTIGFHFNHLIDCKEHIQTKNKGESIQTSLVLGLIQTLSNFRKIVEDNWSLLKLTTNQITFSKKSSYYRSKNLKDILRGATIENSAVLRTKKAKDIVRHVVKK